MAPKETKKLSDRDKIHQYARTLLKNLNALPKKQSTAKADPASKKLELVSHKILTRKTSEESKKSKSWLQERAKPIRFKHESIDTMTEEERTVLHRIILAMNHYVKGDQSLIDKPQELMSHLKGIDFSQPVIIKHIPPDVILTQMQAPGVGMGETRQGNYYSYYVPKKEELPLEAHLRGISHIIVTEGPTFGKSELKHYVGEKEVTNFKTTEMIEVLESVAAPIEDTWSVAVWNRQSKTNIPIKATGGGWQIHVNSEQNKTIIPMLREDWKAAIDEIKKNHKMLPNSMVGTALLEIISNYALVLYNRAAFNKEFLTPALDAFLYMEQAFRGKHSAMVDDSLDITKLALLTAMKKHDKSNDELKVLTHLNDLLEKRRHYQPTSRFEIT